jgi:hypothetical protein
MVNNNYDYLQTLNNSLLTGKDKQITGLTKKIIQTNRENKILAEENSVLKKTIDEFTRQQNQTVQPQMVFLSAEQAQQNRNPQEQLSIIERIIQIEETQKRHEEYLNLIFKTLNDMEDFDDEEEQENEILYYHNHSWIK